MEDVTIWPQAASHVCGPAFFVTIRVTNSGKRFVILIRPEFEADTSMFLLLMFSREGALA